VQWLTVRDTIGALPADLAVPMAVHAVAARGHRAAARIALLAGLVGAGLGGLSWPQLPVPVVLHLVVAVFLGSTVVAAWAIGTLGHVRRERLAALAERTRLLEIEGAQQAQIVALAERARIAREMHDVVAHTLTVMITQADGGRYAAVSSPQAAQAALTTIADSGRRALGEMRRVLGLLRADGPGGPPLLPQPGIADIAELVDRVRAGGLDVRLTLEPPRVPMDPGLGLVAYRIVQEGLTNVIKHAGPAAVAEVSVRCGSGQLEIEVLDDGRGPSGSPGTGGHGVLGMRERARAYGGTVQLSPRPGGGQVLRARIPVPS